MNNSNNIVSIISPQWGTAGTDINLLKIAEKLVKDGFDVRLLIVGDEWQGRELPSEIKTIYLIPKFIFKLIKNKYIYWKITMSLSVIFSIVPLILYILRNKSNYILGLVPILGILGLWFCNTKSKIIFSIQGLPRSKIVFNLNLYFLKFLNNVTYVIPTKSMKEYLASIYKQSKSIEFQVIPNAVLDNELIRKSKELVHHKWYNNEDLFVITAVGRLTNQKDFTNLINAFALIANSLDFIKLVIIGSGEQKEILQSLVEALGLESKVQFLGFQSNPYKFMNASDLFVMSSKWEGPGHVLIEALGTGCPVVTTNCPIGPADSIQNGEFGELVEVGNSSALSEAILYAYNNQSNMLERVIKSGNYLKKFYTENVVNEYKKLLINDNR
tara:strand:- start:310 stop:1464 length:1155 start_codon:yes stop_codon:yes gene_type:complete